MKNYAIHDQAGLLLYESFLHDNVEPQLMEGQFFTEVGHPIGMPPFEGARFHVPTLTWVDGRTLDDVRRAKWSEIKKHRDRIEFGPFIYNDMEFDGDFNAQRRLNSYISLSKSAIAAGQPLSVTFTLRDNTDVELSAEDFIGIEQTKIQQVAEAFAKASTLRSLIGAATNMNEVLAISWESF